MQEEDLLGTATSDSPVHEEPSNIVANTSAAAKVTARNAATQSTVSGLYVWKKSSAAPVSDPGSPHPVSTDSDTGGKVISEELRLDVDGRYPQMVASGVLHGGISSRVHWIANLVERGPDTWAGDIFYKEGKKASFPYKSVMIEVTPDAVPNQRQAQVLLSGGGATKRTRLFSFATPNFHTVDFEFDFVQGEKVLLNIKTHEHHNRPRSLEAENLSVMTVFERAGFAVTHAQAH